MEETALLSTDFPQLMMGLCSDKPAMSWNIISWNEFNISSLWTSQFNSLAYFKRAQNADISLELDEIM